MEESLIKTMMETKTHRTYFEEAGLGHIESIDDVPFYKLHEAPPMGLTLSDDIKNDVVTQDDFEFSAAYALKTYIRLFTSYANKFDHEGVSNFDSDNELFANDELSTAKGAREGYFLGLMKSMGVKFLGWSMANDYKVEDRYYRYGVVLGSDKSDKILIVNFCINNTNLNMYSCTMYSKVTEEDVKNEHQDNLYKYVQLLNGSEQWYRLEGSSVITGHSKTASCVFENGTKLGDLCELIEHVFWKGNDGEQIKKSNIVSIMKMEKESHERDGKNWEETKTFRNPRTMVKEKLWFNLLEFTFSQTLP